MRKQHTLRHTRAQMAFTPQRQLTGPAFSPLPPSMASVGGPTGRLLQRRATPVSHIAPAQSLPMPLLWPSGALGAVAPEPQEAKHSRDPGGQRADGERHGMGMLTYTAGARDHRAARQSSHMQMGRREQ